MLKKTIKKVKNKNGETLAEVLISILIIAIGLVLLSTLILYASHTMDKSEEIMQKMYIGTNRLEVEGAYKSGTDQLRIESKKNASAITIYVDIYEDEDSGLKAYYMNQPDMPPEPVQP